jgi:Cys-tRNA(Pro)/Cys-tRNA(Cys) deacylase
MITNNVTRLLEARKVPFTAYELPEEKLGAEETARQLNVPVEQVFKTIVTLREAKGKPVLAMIPGPLEVDLKKLARVAGEKKMNLASQREAESLTGLLTGGISPLALLNKPFQVILDETALLFDEIHISGGQRGLNIRLPVRALMDLTAAALADISV